MGLPTDATITWYGHACAEVRMPDGRVIVINPWFGNPTRPKPPEAVDRCDLLLVTHGHGDQLAMPWHWPTGSSQFGRVSPNEPVAGSPAARWR